MKRIAIMLLMLTLVGVAGASTFSIAADGLSCPVSYQNAADALTAYFAGSISQELAVQITNAYISGSCI